MSPQIRSPLLPVVAAALALLALGLTAADASAKKAKKPSRLWYQLTLRYNDERTTEYRTSPQASDRPSLRIDNQQVSWRAESNGSVLLRKRRDGELRIAAGDFAGRLTRNDMVSQENYVASDGSPNCTFNERRQLVEQPQFAGTNFTLETTTPAIGMTIGPPLGLPGQIQYLATTCKGCIPGSTAGSGGPGGRPVVRAPDNDDQDRTCIYGERTQRISGQMGSYVRFAEQALARNRTIAVSGEFGAPRITAVLSSSATGFGTVNGDYSKTDAEETASYRFVARLIRCPRRGLRRCRT